jgi:hypothetical protein
LRFVFLDPIPLSEVGSIVGCTCGHTGSRGWVKQSMTIGGSVSRPIGLDQQVVELEGVGRVVGS